MIEALIRRWYDELWNPWNIHVLSELAAPSLTFRGSLGAALSGHDQVMAYIGGVHAAFPDFHNEVIGLFPGAADANQAVAHLRYAGTHRGVFRGIEPTGASFTYEALVRFTAREGLLIDVQPLG